MAFYDKFPYTNFQELNLDKILQKVGDIDRAEEATAESAEAAANSASAAADSATDAADSAAAAAVSETNAASSADLVTDIAMQVETNTERIDNILVQGTPTEGNAELIDIRVGANGTTYATAGDAVRNQIEDVESLYANIGDSIIFDADELIITPIAEYPATYINSTGTVIKNAGTRRMRVFKIPRGIITVRMKYNSVSCNRCQAGLSNNEVPLENDVTSLISSGSTELSADREFTFENNSYDYLYLYFFTILSSGDVYVKNYKSTQPVIKTDVFSEADYNILNDIREKEAVQLFPTDWVQGSQTDGVITPSASGNRLFSEMFTVPIQSTILIYVPDGYNGNLLGYESSGTYHGSLAPSWLPAGYNYLTLRWPSFRFTARKTDNSAIPTTAVKDFRFYKIKDEYRYQSYPYSGKILSILGDSLSTWGGPEKADTTEAQPSPEGNRYNYVGHRCRYPQRNLNVTDVHQMYWMQLIDVFNMQLGVNESYAGSRVTWNGTSTDGTLAKENCLSSQERISHMADYGTPDYIIINAGTNDINQNVPLGTIDYDLPATDADYSDLPVTTFSDAYRTMLLRCQQTYPNAKIICLLPNFARSYTAQQEDPYEEIIKEICDLLGVIYIDCRTVGITKFNQPTYLGDGTHYNYYGMNMLAEFLIRKFYTI